MRLKTVNIKNFMSIGEITLDLDKPGLHLILGLNKDSEQFDSNGSGKSSLLDAIVWALYGEILRPVALDSLVRTGQDLCEVSVDIDIDTEVINITRSRSISNRKSKLSVTNHFGSEMFVSDSITEMQGSINEILGLDFKTFTNSVYFGKGLSQFFMLADDKTRKDILEAILQLVDFDTVHQKIKLLYKDVDTSINEVKNKLEINKALLASKTKTYDSTHEDYAKQNALVIPKIESFKKEKEEVSTKLLGYRTKLFGINESINKKTIKYTTLKTKIEEEIAFEKEIISNGAKSKRAKVEAAYLRELNGLTTLYNSLIDSLDNKKKNLSTIDLKLEEDKESINEEQADCRAKISDCNNYLEAVENVGAICGVCQSKVTPKHKHLVIEKFEQERKDLNTILDTITDRRFAVIEKIKKNKEEINKIDILKQEALLKLNNDKFAKLSAKTTLIKAIDDSEKEEGLEVAGRYSGRLNQEFLTYNDSVNVLKNEEAKLVAENTYLETRTAAIDTSIESLQTPLDNMAILLHNLYVELAELDDEKREYTRFLKANTKELETLAFWVEAFSQKGIRSFIFETSLPELSSRANYYSNALSGGSISINILPTTAIKSTGGSKEKLNIIVNNSLGAASYDGCSEGEKRRVDLCLLLALQDLVSSRGTKTWDTAFFDEVFDTLDNTGITAVIDLLRTEAPNKAIYLISHNSDLKNFFDSAIVVIKQDGVSTCQV